MLAVRNYAIALFNTLDDPTSAALQLLREAATVPTDAQTLDRVREDVRQMEEIERGRITRAQRNAWIEEYNVFYDQLAAYKKSIPLYFKEADLRSLRRWVPELTAFIARLNALNDDEVAEARTALAWEIRGLTVDIWNRNQAFGSTALLLVNAGLTIRASVEVAGKLKEDKVTLKRLARKRTLSQVPDQVWVLGIIGAIIFVVSMCGKLTDSPPKIPAGSSNTDTATQVSSAIQSYQDSVNQAATYEPKVSKYAGNQLKNGASPLDKCFGKGKYGGPCWVKFDNSANTTDAIMCLVSAKTRRTVRNEYIRGGTVFKMTHVPRGSYYIKGFYGTDWNPTRRSACGTKGYFDSNQNFTASPNDAFEMISDARGFSTNTITLYGVANGNMSQEPLSAAQFFQQ